jgi:hypothetical protein
MDSLILAISQYVSPTFSFLEVNLFKQAIFTKTHELIATDLPWESSGIHGFAIYPLVMTNIAMV